VANNNYPQITSVTSEALQAQIRNLLPSQEGFGTDLMAQNVIVPVIDLTSAAEGSSVSQMLQTAINFGGATAFNVSNTSSTLINNTGFYRVLGGVTFKYSSGNSLNGTLNLTDGLSTKIIYKFEQNTGGSGSGNNGVSFFPLDFVVFLASGESLTATSNNTFVKLVGSTRQIADINGTLVNPVGFTPQ